MLLFAWEFLRPASHAKWLDNIFYIIIVLLILLIPPTFVIGAKVLNAVLPLVLFVHLFAFLLGVGALHRGYKPARYYMFAWSIYLVVGIGAVLHYEGWSTMVQIIPDQAVQLGSVYLITFQSLALADRINYYKQENLNAQNRLILQQKETLDLKDELNTTLENSRIELEERVEQRTQELSELNLKLSEEITERKHAEDELKHLAAVDFLTGLFNRRHFFEIASREFVKSTRYDRPLSVIIFDIDLFKDVNDTYGHLVGDQVLVHLGHLVRGMTRESDIAARYGGEEFVILLPETDCNKARIFAERLRQSIQDSPVPNNSIFIHITVSVGVSGKDDEKHAKLFDELISQADQSLYKAKSLGRNRVICHWDN
jgi:diguanylate cyclase (GGDEF)-like protein